MNNEKIKDLLLAFWRSECLDQEMLDVVESDIEKNVDTGNLELEKELIKNYLKEFEKDNYIIVIGNKVLNEIEILERGK